MTGASSAYAVVTPVRDEAVNVRRLAACLAEQTIPPAAWVIVDTGSRDETSSVAAELARQHPWVRTLETAEPDGHVRGGPIVRAFSSGLAALDPRPHLVAKVDADISFDHDYFKRLVSAFGDHPALAIASGTCYEQEGGIWAERYATGGSVWGAARVYRSACLDDVLPLEERIGWDGIDVLRARAAGWSTEILRDLPFRHHRPEGIRDGSRRRAWEAQGRAAYFMDYRPSYLIARSVHRALREPAALAMLSAYVTSALRSEPRCADTAVRTSLREGQRLRYLLVRAREARGMEPDQA